MNDYLLAQQRAYADLIIHSGVNLQPGQGVAVRAELGHRDFVRLLTAAAYDAGAKQVEVLWHDPLVSKIRFQHVAREHLGFVPEFEVARANEFLDQRWARVSLTGDEYPDALEEVEPAVLREYQRSVYQKLGFFQQRVMNNEVAWCVAGVPMAPWAQKVFPGLDATTATERLWELVLRVCRADLPDPQAAWQENDANLKRVSAFMDRHQVRAVRFLDRQLGPDGQAATDLTVGLTERPNWSCGTADSAAGHPFFANIPTEEIFSTPNRSLTQGWVRTSKPGFPFAARAAQRLVPLRAGRGGGVARGQGGGGAGRAVPDTRRAAAGRGGPGGRAFAYQPERPDLPQYPVRRERRVPHRLWPRYPEGIKGGSKLSREELDALGLNSAETHSDLMIGTETMQVIGTCADGSEVLIMDDGMFVDAVLE